MLQVSPLNKSANQFPALLIVVVLLYCAPVAAASGSNSELTGLSDYPRIENFEQGSVKVDFPTIESWPDFRYLQAWLPVEVSLNGDSKPRIGSVHLRAMTKIDFEKRTVRISDPKVLETKFSESKPSKDISSLAAQAFVGGSRIVPLDVLLRLLPEDFVIPASSGGTGKLNFEPPAIVVSDTPLKLLPIDKKPIKAPIDGTSLEFVVNTNWNVFYDGQDERWYVLNDGAWQTNNYLADGGWTTTDKLPDDFQALAGHDEWQDVQKALPAKLPANPPTPFMISLQMTELILLDGSPRLTAIEGTGIYYARNTESDLFKLKGRWYYLVSGRWFTNDDLSGQWQSVKYLPDAFAQIPVDHKMGHVLSSVAGTRQAKLALIEAALPRRTSVSKGSAADLKVSWAGEPKFEGIENTQLQRGLNTPYQVIRYNNFNYLCYQGAWYLSDSPTGPWQATLAIPDEIYRIPATDPAYNVTFVRPDEEQEPETDHVNYNFTSGYTGSYSTTVTVVHGTGWYYPSGAYWGAGRMPMYWHNRPTYGYNMGYNPMYGGFGGRFGNYGGWGGYQSIEISSPTVDFNHDYGSAWEGPLQTTPGDPTKAREESLDQFLPAKKTDGTEKFTHVEKSKTAATSSVTAASLIASSALSSNLFSGPDGEVYKHENDEWQQYSDGSWSTAERRKRGYESQRSRPPSGEVYPGQWVPAHKKVLSRGELDRQNRARIEGMDNYAKYRMKRESEEQP